MCSFSPHNFLEAVVCIAINILSACTYSILIFSQPGRLFCLSYSMPYIHSITHQKEQNFLYKMNYCFTHNRPYLIHIFLYCVVIFFFFFLYSLFPNTVDCFVIHILCQLHHCTYTSIDTPYRKLLITWKRSGSVGSSTGKLQTTVRCTCVETVPRPPTTIILHLA